MMTDEALKIEIQTLRDQLATSEKSRLEFATLVKDQALAMGNCCAVEDYNEAIKGAFALSLLAASEQALIEIRMKLKAAPLTDIYDLSTLRVDASVPSDSETGYEDRD